MPLIARDVNEYVRWNIPRPQWYVQDILPKNGKALLYGAPKSMKSWLTLGMAYCIATGTDWVGFRTERARVAIVNFEIADAAYHWRMKDMHRVFGLENGFLFEITSNLLYIENPENMNELIGALTPVRPNVIMLDCMSAFFGGDENNGEAMAFIISRIVALQEMFDASVLIVHHTRKSLVGASSTDVSRGHSRLTGWPDTLIYLAQQPTGLQLQVKSRQATHEIHPVNIQFDNMVWSRR